MRLSADGMWGRANYFAVDATYSNSYSHKLTEMVDSVRVRQMLLAKVRTKNTLYLTMCLVCRADFTL